MRDFVFLLGKHRWEYILLVVCTSLLMGGEALIQPLLMKAIFDGVAEQTRFSAFIPLGLGYLALGVTVNALSYFVFNWRTKVDNKIVSTVSTQMLSAFYSTSYSALLENGAGHYVSRIRSDVKDGLAPMLSSVRDVTAGITSFAMLISVLIYISLSAFIVLVALIPICALVSLVLSKRIRRLTHAERDHEATIIDVLSRSIAAFKIVRHFRLASEVTTNFTRSLDEGLASSFARTRMVRLLQVAGDMTRVLSDVSSIFVGAFLVIRRQMSVGSFIAFMNAFWRSSSTLFQVLNKWAEMHSHASTISRIAAFQRDQAPATTVKNGDAVSVRDVRFRYLGDTVFENVSFAVKPGERVLITGANGSGKTTLANILCGLLPPSHGELILPSRISGATLPTHFPPTSVASLGIDEALLERLGMDAEDVRTARPDFLSAGQQQKLAVAMAISTVADLYVIDEPFANLDMDSRESLLAEILARTDGKMLVLIAHDASGFAHLFDRRVQISRTVSDRMILDAA